MIENVTNRDQKDRQRAKRMGVAPSASLRSHFMSLARQVRRWSETKTEIVDRPVTIGITSLNSGAGKSTVSYNLSAAVCSIGRTATLLANLISVATTSHAGWDKLVLQALARC